MTLVSLMRIARPPVGCGGCQRRGAHAFSKIAKRVNGQRTHQAEAPGREDAREIGGHLDQRADAALVLRRRLADVARKESAEAPEAREPDGHADIAVTGLAGGEETSGGARAARRCGSSAMRRDAERGLEDPDEVEGSDADAARDERGIGGRSPRPPRASRAPSRDAVGCRRRATFERRYSERSPAVQRITSPSSRFRRRAHLRSDTLIATPLARDRLGSTRAERAPAAARRRAGWTRARAGSPPPRATPSCRARRSSPPSGLGSAPFFFKRCARPSGEVTLRVLGKRPFSTPRCRSSARGRRVRASCPAAP